MKNTMTRFLSLGLEVAVSVVLVRPASVRAAPAVEIMRKQRELHRVSDEQETQRMAIVNKNGARKEREVVLHTLTDDSDLSKILIRFRSPRDVEGTAMLTWEKEGGDDDQWLYLPAMHRVKRIASSGKKNRFMGTTFAYEDLRPENLEANAYSLTGTETLDGHECWVIEAVPASEKYARDSGYSKRKLWVRKDNYYSVKREYYDKSGKLEKVQADTKLKNTQGTVWRADQVEMSDVQAGTKTIIVSEKRTQNQGLDESLFTVGELEEGGD